MYRIAFYRIPFHVFFGLGLVHLLYAAARVRASKSVDYSIFLAQEEERDSRALGMGILRS